MTDAARRALVTTASLRRAGLTLRGIALQVRSGALVRVRRGYFVAADEWAALFPEHRHLIAIVAAQAAAARTLVFSHRSAATLHGLPVWATWLGAVAESPDPLRVDVMAASRGSGNSTGLLVTHASPVPAAELCTVAGLAATSPERTLIDLARTGSFSVALAAADSLLRHRHAASRFGADDDAVHAWRAATGAWLRTRKKWRGAIAVAALSELADPRAESPLESQSRLRLAQLGVSHELQVPVQSPTGSTLRLDFRLSGQPFWGECDGKSKYFDSGMRGDQSTARIVYEEKRRQDWISGTTGLRCIRWGVREVISLDRFAAHLRAHGVQIPGPGASPYSPATAAFLARLPG